MRLTILTNNGILQIYLIFFINHMKLAIMSDSHDNWDNLKQAIKMSNDMNCEMLLFAGDLIAPPGIKILEEFEGMVKFVWGNNEGEKVKLTQLIDASQTVDLDGDIYEAEIDGLRVFMNHYPKIGELAAKSGDYDLVIHGHTHDYREEKFGDTILINPGEIQGNKNHPSFIIFETTTKEVSKIEL